MFKLVSNYKPTGDQPEAIEYLSKRCKGRKEISNTSWCYRFRKNFYYGKYYTKSSKTNISFST